MGNAIRFIAYTFRGCPKRHKHQRGFFKRNGVTLFAGFAGAAVMTLPLWMVLLGII